MNTETIVDITKEAMLTVIILSAPTTLASLIVGLIVAIFSATTQIQEQTLSFAPKIIAVYLSLIIFGSMLGSFLIVFAKKCFTIFAQS